jgi:hypothetical protein
MCKENAIWNLKFLNPHNSRSLVAILNSFLSPHVTKNSKLQFYRQPFRNILLFSTKEIQTGQKDPMIAPIIHLFQIFMWFFKWILSELKILSLGVFIVSILPHLHLLQSNQAFRVILSSTVYYALGLTNSLPIGGYYSIQPGSTTGLLGNMAVRLAGTSPMWCNHWFTLCS